MVTVVWIRSLRHVPRARFLSQIDVVSNSGILLLTFETLKLSDSSFIIKLQNCGFPPYIECALA